MSVEKTSYLLYGFKVTDKEEKKTLNIHYEDLMENDLRFNCRNSEQRIVYDFMCGNYIYVGIVLAKIDEDESDTSIEISDTNFNDLKARLDEYMKDWPKCLLNVVNDKEPKLYFFIHSY